MKNINIFGALFFAMVIAANCGEPAVREEIVIGILKQHDTRISVICEIGGGKYLEKSIHGSQSVICGSIAINADDYLSGKKKYGPLPGQKAKYDEYLKSKEKK